MRVPAKISLHKLVLYVYTNIRLAKGDAVHTAFLDRQLKLLTHETDYRSCCSHAASCLIAHRAFKK